MISISGKKWQQKKTNKNSIEKLQQDHNYSEVLSRLIVSRNFDDSEIHTIENNFELKNVFSNNSDFNQSLGLVISTIKKKHTELNNNIKFVTAKRAINILLIRIVLIV